jgi:hypothetical protein
VAALAKGGPFYLRVLHPTGTGAYAASGTSGGVSPSGTGLQTYTANLPVHSGDLIGIDSSNGSDEIGVADVSGASYASIFPLPGDGATVPARAPARSARSGSSNCSPVACAISTRSITAPGSCIRLT